MDWFQRLTSNPYVNAVLVADNRDNILRSSYPLRSDHAQLASMLQSAEVLAQTLASELNCGQAQLLQFSTQWEHILLFPLFQSTFYLVVQVERTAPLTLIMVDVERALAEIKREELSQMEVAKFVDDTPVLDAAELIEAVREWLRSRSS
ncbi:MAG: roadblock/LC7 domain-containing protein [Anaerolineae bacterium]|nr:roadblock/LC7 domain-containing protein [Anaerolineae bacterium]